MVVSCKVWDDSNEKVSYNYAIIKRGLIEISNLHNYDLGMCVFNFPFSETSDASFDSMIVIFELSYLKRSLRSVVVLDNYVVCFQIKKVSLAAAILSDYPHHFFIPIASNLKNVLSDVQY